MATINWYPGHMAKSRRMLIEQLRAGEDPRMAVKCSYAALDMAASSEIGTPPTKGL